MTEAYIYVTVWVRVPPRLSYMLIGILIIKPRYPLRVFFHDLGAVCELVVGNAPARDKGVHISPRRATLP